MAATRLISMHRNKGKTLLQSLKERIEYALNPKKTEEMRYVSSYECDQNSAAEEFYLSKRQYQHITGKDAERNVIAYQIRQSFKPGEITPEEANQVGYELGMRFTKGNHAFIVATHTDKAHVHNHIIFNSTSLDCTRKFKDFFLSGIALQKVSDRICAEHGLSIITPKPYRERTKRTEYPKKVSHRDMLCAAIDQILSNKPKDFAEFLQGLKTMGFEYKDGKHLAFRGKDQKRFIRLRSLGEGYCEEELRAVIAGKTIRKIDSSRQKNNPKNQFTLLIDIQEKMAEGRTIGYEKWAKKFNRKEAAKTVCLLKERGIDSYDELVFLTSKLTSRFDELSVNIKAAEKRMAEIKILREHINNYSHTRNTYKEYRKSGYSKKFFEEHREEIQIHKAAKKAFDELGVKKLPSRKDLDVEFHECLTQKKQAYAEYRQVKKEMQEYLIAKQNVEVILNIDRKEKEEKEKSPFR